MEEDKDSFFIKSNLEFNSDKNDKTISFFNMETNKESNKFNILKDEGKNKYEYGRGYGYSNKTSAYSKYNSVYDYYRNSFYLTFTAFIFYSIFYSIPLYLIMIPIDMIFEILIKLSKYVKSKTKFILKFIKNIVKVWLLTVIVLIISSFMSILVTSLLSNIFMNLPKNLEKEINFNLFELNNNDNESIHSSEISHNVNNQTNMSYLIHFKSSKSTYNDLINCCNISLLDPDIVSSYNRFDNKLEIVEGQTYSISMKLKLYKYQIVNSEITNLNFKFDFFSLNKTKERNHIEQDEDYTNQGKVDYNNEYTILDDEAEVISNENNHINNEFCNNKFTMEHECSYEYINSNNSNCDNKNYLENKFKCNKDVKEENTNDCVTINNQKYCKENSNNYGNYSRFNFDNMFSYFEEFFQ